jgi:hypothetical protein
MRADSVTGQTPSGALRPGGGMEPDVATARVPGPIVGAQWELRRAMARTDQRFGHSDIFVRAHVDRRLPRGDRPSGCFSSQHRQHPFRAAREGRARTKLLIPRRLARDGSPGVVQSQAFDSRVPPRSETSARGATLLPREAIPSAVDRTPRYPRGVFRVLAALCGRNWLFADLSPDRNESVSS